MEKILENKNNIIIVEDGDLKILFSYTTKIAEYNKADHVLTIGNSWKYSRTTSKHLYYFLNEYTTIKANSQKEIVSMLNSGTSGLNKVIKGGF